MLTFYFNSSAYHIEFKHHLTTPTEFIVILIKNLISLLANRAELTNLRLLNPGAD